METNNFKFEKRTKAQKTELLRKWLEYLVNNGHSIDYYLFKPMSYFDWEELEKIVRENNIDLTF